MLMQVIIATLLLVVVLQNDMTLTTASGEKKSGNVISCSEDQLVFNDGDDDKTYSFEQLADVEFGPVNIDLAGELQITLVDDSCFLASTFTSQNGKSIPGTKDGLAFEIENRNLRHVLLQPLPSEELRLQWASLKAVPLESGDAIVVKRSGQLETLEGVVGEVTLDKVEFRLDDRSAEIDRKKIFGLIYYRAGRDLPNAACEVTLMNGSALQARSIAWAIDTTEIATTSGAKFSLPSKDVARLNFAIGRAVLLGDMVPSTSDWSPLMTSSAILQKLKKIRLPRANRSLENGPLDLTFYSETSEYTRETERREFKSGYAMVGGSKLVFALSGKFERLTGVAGFAPAANRSGNVILKIRCDSETVFEQPMVNDDELNPIELDVNVKGVKRLVIEVGYQDGRAVGDMLHLCDLKVSR